MLNWNRKIISVTFVLLQVISHLLKVSLMMQLHFWHSSSHFKTLFTKFEGAQLKKKLCNETDVRAAAFTAKRWKIFKMSSNRIKNLTKVGRTIRKLFALKATNEQSFWLNLNETLKAHFHLFHAHSSFEPEWLSFRKLLSIGGYIWCAVMFR